MANLKPTLSIRLQMIYDQLLPDEEVWDLCCDHGYLGLHAHFSARFLGIRFVDQAVHLVEALREKWQQVSGLRFFAMPAQKLEEALKGNVVVAGVGAESIRQIVSGLMESGQLQAQRLVLSPHKDSEMLQTWLNESWLFVEQYELLQIVSVREKERLREIYVFSRR